MKRLVIGILAHVDAGKTTLSEGMLYHCGAIASLGRVDHQTAFLDHNGLERERGITIFSKQAVMTWKAVELVLLDTPGHVDFSGEMERALGVLDYAVLVVSGSAGVQGHTRTLWRLLESYGVPTMLFVNKMDLPGANRGELMAQLREQLGDGFVDFCAEEESLWEESALCDEAALEEYLESGRLTDKHLASLICRRRMFPCFFGSALKLQGVEALLDGLARYTAPSAYQEEFGARVYKITRDSQGGRLTWLKLTGGSLAVKTSLELRWRGGEPVREKVDQIRIYSGGKYQTVSQAQAGMVCAVTGLDHTWAGQGLGGEEDCVAPLLEPVLSYRVLLPEGDDPHTALQALRLLQEEEPQLNVVWDELLGELQIRLMGQVQLEVFQRLLFERFHLAVEFDAGEILYKETIAAPVEGVGHFEPLRHYAEVHLLLEPGPRGSGLLFDTACSEDVLSRSWQRLVLAHLEEREPRGVLAGAPVTDLRITLVAGRAHPKHTEGGDFRQATYRAVRQGLRCAKSILLEPWFQFRLTLPTESAGRAMTDLQRMGAEFHGPELEGEQSLLTGSAPVVKLRDYQMEVISYTAGLGQLTCLPGGYRPCHNTREVVQAIGYNSERDTEHPADSIFCAHGAGFTVKWDQVKHYMHLASMLPQAAAGEPEPAHTLTGRSATVPAGDEELQAIFERTYGPVRRREFSPRREPALWEQDMLARHREEKQGGPEYLLVDGYNIIFAWEDLKEAARENLEGARGKLMDLLSNYQGVRRCQVILVFDAYKVARNVGEVTRYHNIYVVYTKEAETADNYIEKATYKIGKRHRVRVATSDYTEQLIILGHGAQRISAASFYEEVQSAQREIREVLARNHQRTRSRPVAAAMDAAADQMRGRSRASE